MPTPNKKWDVHSHCFTLQHVPEDFFSSAPGGKAFLKISRLDNFWNKVGVGIITSKIGLGLIGLFDRFQREQLQRLKNLLVYKDIDKQVALVVEELKQYSKTKYFGHAPVNLVLLPMDMDFMEAGAPQKSYLEQLEELKAVKQAYGDQVKIFLHTDPRRIAADPQFLAIHLPLFGTLYSGFKLYPTLGYYPFDKRLKPVYDFAVANNYPILSHVSYGPVYRRKNLDTRPHPITKQLFFRPDKPEIAQQNFAHPLNYECLLNPVILSQHWQEAVDYSSLKINMAHFGGPTDWEAYHKNRKKLSKRKFAGSPDPLDINNNWFDGNRFYWYEVIKALIVKYPNVYTDIAFTLTEKSSQEFNEEIAKLLPDPKIGSRILYGTDYYVVASEEKFSEVLRMNYTDNMLDQMCIINAGTFLS